MSEPGTRAVAAIHPIGGGDVDRVAAFLHRELNSRVSVEGWVRGMRPPWMAEAPNHGFMLTVGPDIVGVNVAFYSTRLIRGRPESFCNLAALCCVEPYRPQAVRLLRALLAQRGWHFTDLSPSGNVVAIDRRLGFRDLDTTVSLIPNLPWYRAPRTLLTSDRETISTSLREPERTIFRDHEDSPAVQHTLLRDGAQACYIVTRRDRRKNLALFVTVLHVSNTTLFARHSRAVFAHLGRLTGAPFSLVESRVSQGRPRAAVWCGPGRPKLYRSATIEPRHIDSLYSELTQIAW